MIDRGKESKILKLGKADRNINKNPQSYRIRNTKNDVSFT